MAKLRTDRVNAKILEILEACALSRDPVARVMDHVDLLSRDHTWGTEDVAEVRVTTITIVRGLLGCPQSDQSGKEDTV